MTKKKPPQESNKISQVYQIKANIHGRKITKLAISYHYEKRNIEYLKGCEKRGIKPDLDRLFDNKTIIDLVKQIHEKELESRGTHPNWDAWKYYAYEPVIDKRNQRNYKIIIFLDDEDLNFVGFVNILYPDEKKQYE